MTKYVTRTPEGAWICLGRHAPAKYRSDHAVVVYLGEAARVLDLIFGRGKP